FVGHVAELASRDRTRVIGVAGTPFRAGGSAAALASRAQREVQTLVSEARMRYVDRYGF
ncbi:MAG: hypothetical protein H5U40_07840, partial [Polyangiaceae bacterium]|nr:hypothetical protein [Polyangiaceae bacterium]